MSNPGDSIIGKISYHHRDNDYYIRVTHINPKNKYPYNDLESVKIQNKLPKKISGKNLIGKDIKCTIQYRNEYGQLLCTVEECVVETKIKIKKKK